MNGQAGRRAFLGFPAMAAVAILGAALVVHGCKRSSRLPGVTSTTTRPATAPVAVAATRPATRPAASVLLINGQQYVFPRARLLIVQKEPSILLHLFTDDPRQAIDADYGGNSYFLAMTLDTSDVDRIANMEWQYKAASSDYADTPNGIFLEGNRKQLQPFAVQVAFDRAGGDLRISVDGRFLLFNVRGNERGGVAEAAMVHGTLLAELETPK